MGEGAAVSGYGKKGTVMGNVQGKRSIVPVQMGSPAARIDVRLFNFILAGLIFCGFLVMGLGVGIVSQPAFTSWFASNALLGIAGMIVGPIVGVVLMSGAVKRQSVARSIAGFAIFVSTFGLLCAMVVAQYDLPTINTAFVATAAITAVFGVLGLAFPQVFQRISGVLMVALVALCVVEIAMALMGVDQTWLDIAGIVVFCGFIGYDMYQAATVEPTVPNAVFMASNLFLDIMNVFIRVLDIVDNR